MSSRENNHDNEHLTKNARLAELWSELLELRRKVRQAETQTKKNPVANLVQITIEPRQRSSNNPGNKSQHRTACQSVKGRKDRGARAS
jgi:hypothetical protein